MSFRTVIVKERSKLDLKMGYLVSRNQEGETRVYIPEISCLILESTSLSLTTALLSELVKNNVAIILCDEKHNPESQVLPYYGSYNTSKKLMQQQTWQEKTKQSIWKAIIEQKIEKQAKVLELFDKKNEATLLLLYAHNVKINDKTNREGHAAKVYFNALFGLDFARREDSKINTALNYGYALLLSCFNREVVSSGYATQLGIWHKNEFNNFNLASDLMEPFRPIVDNMVLKLDAEQAYKPQMLNLFNLQVKINGKMQYLENAISIYCQSVFEALNTNNVGDIIFYDM